MKKFLFPLLTLFLGTVSVNSQNSKKISLNFGTTIIMRVVDKQTNGEEKLDNSIDEKEKYLSIACEFDNVKMGGTSFTAIAYSKPFFMYKEVIKLRGEFSPDKKMIEHMSVDYTKTNLAGDPELSFYSTLEIYMKFDVKNVPLTQAKIYDFTSDGENVTIREYEYHDIEHNSANRSGIYQEFFVKQVKKPNSTDGNILFLDAPMTKSQGVTVRVSPINKNANNDEKALIMGWASFIIADLSNIPGVVCLEGMYTDVMFDEAELSTRGLVNKESSIDADVQKFMLESNVDMAIFINAKTLSENPKTIQLTLKYVISEKSFTYNDVVQPPNNYAEMMKRISNSMYHAIKRIQDSKE